MYFKTLFSVLAFILLSGGVLKAQRIKTIHDSSGMYKIVDTYYKPGKIRTFIHRIINKSVVFSIPKAKYKKKQLQKPYSDFDNKIIRFIKIETLNPFGNSIGDTIVAAQNILTKTGNKLHIKTRERIIRNLLLIKENQLFDSLLVNESERLIRSQSYVQDVSFFVKSTAKNSDSIDVVIRVLDKWSVSGKYSNTNERLLLNIVDKNFLGYGHEFKNEYVRFHTDSSNAFNTNYFIPNVGNTYFNSTLHYGTDELGVSQKSVAIERPFYSPFTRWAGGVGYSQQLKYDDVLLNNNTIDLQAVKWNTHDYWAAHAMQLSKGNSEQKRQTSFITAARFIHINYLLTPAGVVDTPFQYADENFYLASAGISTRQYVQDKYVFNYGLVEDVPVGKVYSITTGYQERNNSTRLYFGGRISHGQYFSWGYLSSSLQFGTFLNNSRLEQSVVSTGMNYFSELFKIGKWRFRQFVKPMLTLGINRLPYEKLTLNDGYGIEGFRSATLTGNSRLVLTMQTQSYAPWDILGFRFGPYVNCSLGMLGYDAVGFWKSNIYSQFGLGVLIKNENLIINTFQFSFSFYPSMPGTGHNMLIMNSFQTNDFGLSDFEIGKPAIVRFQ